LDGGHFRLYDPAHDPAPIDEGSAIPKGKPAVEDHTEPECSTEFAYEADLRNYLAKNLSIIEPGLKLYQDEGITGIEFDVGGRRIDILAVDAKGALVVIELKVSRGYDRVVGQLMRYMAWIRKNQAEPGQQVRGVIVAREISADLLLACSLLAGVQLFEYELSLKLKPVNTASST
jgi:RecB family endonuclease NucS